MAHRVRRGFVSRGGQLRRETLWISLADSSVTMGAGTATLLGSLNVAALALRPFTIIRVRGYLYLRSDQEAASESYAVSYGMAVVSDQASAIGVTAVPTPIVDRGSDLWFLYESLAGRLIRASGVGLVEAGIFTKFDSKAMRKVNGDQDLVIVAENSGTSTDGITIVEGARILLKLH